MNGIVKNGLAAAIAAACASLASPAVADDAIAVNWDGNVYTVDTATGAGTFLNASGFIQINAMAKSPDGTLYATSGFGAIALLTIDPDTGLGDFVANVPLGSVRGSAFTPDGTLYVVEDVGFGLTDQLYEVDSVTGNATFIGDTRFPGIQGLAATPDGTLYAWDVGFGDGGGAGLVTLDTSSGVGSDVSGAFGDDLTVQTLASGADGTLYGGRDSIYEIDPDTGAKTFIGSGGYSDLRGIELVSESFRLNVGGACPGTVTVDWSNATPNTTLGLLFALNTGSVIIPNGQPCAGTQLGLGANQLQLVNTFPSGDSGSGQRSAPAGIGACGGFLQLIVAGSCATSNVDQIP